MDDDATCFRNVDVKDGLSIYLSGVRPRSKCSDKPVHVSLMLKLQVGWEVKHVPDSSYASFTGCEDFEKEEN